jgi:hypothetical protein
MSFAYSPINLNGTGGTSTGAGIGTRVAATGGDYPTIAAAAAASQTVVHVIGDVIETQNIQVPGSGMDITLYNDARVAMGTNSFQVEAGENLFVRGNGIINFGAITAGTLFAGSGALHVENVTITNTSNNAICVTNMDYARFDSVRFEGDVRICGDFNIYSDCQYRNGTVLFTTAANKSAVHGAVTENVLIVDSGTNSVVSDILSG